MAAGSVKFEIKMFRIYKEYSKLFILLLETLSIARSIQKELQDFGLVPFGLLFPSK